MGTLPAARRCNRNRLSADEVIAYVSFGRTTEWYPGDATTSKLRVSLISLFDGFDVHDDSIENSCYVARRDGQLNKTPFNVSTARSCPEKGGCDIVTFSDWLHITRYGVGGPGHVFPPLKAHETWMNVEPFSCNRPERPTAL